MQRLSTYKRKAGVLFMDTRPVYFGKIFFQKPKAEKAWAALSRNALAQRKDGYKRQKKRKQKFVSAKVKQPAANPVEKSSAGNRQNFYNQHINFLSLKSITTTKVRTIRTARRKVPLPPAFPTTASKSAGC